MRQAKMFKVLYYMPNFQNVLVMTVHDYTLEAAEEEVRNRLRMKAGIGVWKYEMYQYTMHHEGEVDTRQKVGQKV